MTRRRKILSSHFLISPWHISLSAFSHEEFRSKQEFKTLNLRIGTVPQRSYAQQLLLIYRGWSRADDLNMSPLLLLRCVGQNDFAQLHVSPNTTSRSEVGDNQVKVMNRWCVCVFFLWLQELMWYAYGRGLGLGLAEQNWTELILILAPVLGMSGSLHWALS